MLSSTLKRSAATLGVVVAGLLAAAGPASAQILDGPVLVKAGPQPEAGGYLATDPSSEGANQMMKCLVDYAPGVCYFHTVKAPANAVTASFSALSRPHAAWR